MCAPTTFYLNETQHIARRHNTRYGGDSRAAGEGGVIPGQMRRKKRRTDEKRDLWVAGRD